MATNARAVLVGLEIGFCQPVSSFVGRPRIRRFKVDLVRSGRNIQPQHKIAEIASPALPAGRLSRRMKRKLSIFTFATLGLVWLAPASAQQFQDLNRPLIYNEFNQSQIYQVRPASRAADETGFASGRSRTPTSAATDHTSGASIAIGGTRSAVPSTPIASRKSITISQFRLSPLGVLCRGAADLA